MPSLVPVTDARHRSFSLNRHRYSPQISENLSSIRLSLATVFKSDRLLEGQLNTFAVVLLSLLDAAGEAVGYDRYPKTNTVERRTHSLFRQGGMSYDLLPNMPDKWLQPIMQ